MSFVMVTVCAVALFDAVDVSPDVPADALLLVSLEVLSAGAKVLVGSSKNAVDDGPC